MGKRLSIFTAAPTRSLWEIRKLLPPRLAVTCCIPLGTDQAAFLRASWEHIYLKKNTGSQTC